MVSKNGKDFNERVKIDVRKNSETFHVQEASSGKEAGDIVYDFEKVINFDKSRMEMKSSYMNSNFPRRYFSTYLPQG